MSKILQVCAVLCLCVSMYSYAKCEDMTATESVAIQQPLDAKAAALLSSPAGVFDVEIVDGQIVRLKIKGEADVPTSMRGSRGDRYAREKANRDARAAFTKYLGENVIFSESEAEGITIQEKDGQESSEVVNASAKLYSSNSAAMLKGLVVLLDHIEGEGDGRTCTVVLGWSRKLSDAANTARADMARFQPEKEEPSNPVAAPAATNQPAGNTETVTRVGNLDDF